jgi:hypothetical protein
MRLLRNARPTPALAVAILALVAAVAGTAVAADPVANTAVSKKKTKKIANKQIDKRLPWGTDDIADGAVTGGKIADGAVTDGKIADNAVNGAKVADDSIGSADLGPVVQRTANISVPAGSARIVGKNCEPGELALSVGANWNGAATVGPVLQAATFLSGAGGTNPTGGSAAGRNEGAGARTLTVIVSCLAP